MGRMVMQRILECHECGKTPDDGEKMWEMPEGFICEQCSEKDEEEAAQED